MSGKLTMVLMMSVLFMPNLVGCNMGPGMDNEVSEREDAINYSSYQVEPAPCAVNRWYFERTCKLSGERILEKVGAYVDDCGFVAEDWGPETDCYADFATYDCETGEVCGEYQLICDPCPVWSLPSFNPADQFAR